jgi:hypothetical protein
MGNTNNLNNSNKPKYEHTHRNMNDEDIEEIKKYKIINTNILDEYIINQLILTDEYFNKYPVKSKVVNNMLNYCLQHEEKEIFKRTDYICNKRIKVCICNNQADYFRRMANKNITEGKQNISWCKKS